MEFKLLLCFSLIVTVISAEKDSPKAVVNERAKKEVIIPPPGEVTAYNYYGYQPSYSGVYGNGLYGNTYGGAYGYNPYIAEQQYYGSGRNVHPYGLYDDGKYHPGKHYDDGKYYVGKYDKATVATAVHNKPYFTSYNGYNNHFGHNGYNNHFGHNGYNNYLGYNYNYNGYPYAYYNNKYFHNNYHSSFPYVNY